jgi:hypothetical protein
LRSLSISARSWPSNPYPDIYYLKHVGFLGAAAPAVKGLKEPAFAAIAYAEVDLAPCEACSFSAPVGYSVDPVGLDLHRRALTLQACNPGMDYLEAVREAARG